MWICVCTIGYVGRAVARLLQSGVGSDEYANKLVYISTSTLSQLEIFDPVMRVARTGEWAWVVTYESAKEVYRLGKEEMKGNRMGFGRMFYSRLSFEGEDADVVSGDELVLDGVLELEKDREDVDEVMRRAVEMAGKK